MPLVSPGEDGNIDTTPAAGDTKADTGVLRYFENMGIDIPAGYYWALLYGARATTALWGMSCGSKRNE